MAETTKIAWCDATASPWHGCSHALLPDGSNHPGCLNCYAEAMSVRNPATLGVWGDDGVRVKSKTFVDKLLKWDAQARAAGRDMSVFPSICDPFEDRSELEPWRREMFEVIGSCPNVRLLLLTKRPQNVRPKWPITLEQFLDASTRLDRDRAYFPNIHLGVSASDQKTWDWATSELDRLTDLCPVRFVSLEPFLGPVDTSRVLVDRDVVIKRLMNGPMACNRDQADSMVAEVPVQQVIIGCESNGPRVGRLGEFSHEQEWIEAAHVVVDQCLAADVAVFVKQIPLDGKVCHDIERFPAALRHQQFPKVEAR